ncbi:GGDEF domain-containing protein [Croceibacterium ferulae]|uniref:GGDEF domain-containing protein n=1 Tax=Croceibacterium ferulae TaxID=1854641 RepID=UPI000EB0B717|nr:GGDEF domain-containing protein [Croceibacterium ferulae]
MHFDLLTLYYLAIGTLLLSAALTLWDRQAHPQRGRELRIAAIGYVVLAAGCVLATSRNDLPYVSGALLSNVVLTSGYLVVLHAVAQMNGRSHRIASLALILGLAATWAVAGAGWKDHMWNHVSAVPIALVSAMTALEVRNSRPLQTLRSRHIFVAVSAGHALFYAARACILPLCVAQFGPEALAIAAKATMYEGVLYSVGLPMALLGLVREEAHERVLGASRTDYLTGLANRRWFFEQGGRIIRDAPAGQPISLLAFDLDHFKSINDTFGHAAGDEVLRLFAQAVQARAGADTLLARIGGEEFAALLPGCGGQHAMVAGQAIARAFKAAVAGDGRYGRLNATVSIGVSEHPFDGADLGRLLSAADRALYTAKARGRDRIELAPPLELAVAC